MDFLTDPRFKGIEKFQNKVWLSSPTMHGDEQRWVDEAIQTNWVSTVGANINEVERQMAKETREKLREEKTEAFKETVAKKSEELKNWFSHLGKGE